VGLVLLLFMGYVLVLTCTMGQIQINVERSSVSMVDANHLDAPSESLNVGIRTGRSLRE